MITLPLLVGSFVAGLGMFLAPCTLPIVPGYLAFIAGGSQQRGIVFKNALAFVIGFSIIFIILGTFAVGIGHLLGPWRVYLPQVSGAITILFGLTVLGLRVPGLSLERHIRLPNFLKVGKPQSSFLIGALFALGWSPCIGPILGTILLVASTSTTALQGAVLLAVFSVGMGLPFLLCAVLMDAAVPFVSGLTRLTNAFAIFGGLVLVALGVLMLTNEIGLLSTWAFSFFNFLGYDRLLNYL